jgi:hypothetical protein
MTRVMMDGNELDGWMGGGGLQGTRSCPDRRKSVNGNVNGRQRGGGSFCFLDLELDLNCFVESFGMHSWMLVSIAASMFYTQISLLGNQKKNKNRIHIQGVHGLYMAAKRFTYRRRGQPLDCLPALGSNPSAHRP